MHCPVFPALRPLLPALLVAALAGCMATAPPTTDPHAEARAAFDQGRLHRVIDLLQPLAARGETSPDEMHMLADAHMRRGDGGAALPILEAVRPLESANEQTETLRKMGKAAALAGQYPRAIAHLREANGRTPRAESLRLLTELLIASAAIPEAIETGQAAVRMDIENPDGFVLLATAFTLEGVRSQALTAARRAESLGAASAESLVALGNIHLAFDRLPEAIERHERAIALAPSHVEAHQKLGLAQTLFGDAAGAVQTLQRARSLAPDNVEILNNLGVALSELQLHAEAAEAYGEAHRLAPEAAVLLFNQADALALDGRPMEAASLLRSSTFAPDEAPRAEALASRLEALSETAQAACQSPSEGRLSGDAPATPSLEERILQAAIARCR